MLAIVFSLFFKNYTYLSLKMNTHYIIIHFDVNAFFKALSPAIIHFQIIDRKLYIIMINFGILDDE